MTRPSPSWRVGARACVVLVALLAMAAMLVAAASPAVQASRPPSPIILGAAAAGSSQPSVVVERSGATTVAWVAGGRVMVKRRAAGAATFAEVALSGLPAGPALSADLVWDEERRRMLVCAIVGLPTLGVWVARLDDGVAHQVWDSFAAPRTFSVRPSDGALGFVVETHSIQRLIVPASLPLLNRESFFSTTDKGVESALMLSDAVVSRNGIDHEFDAAGRSYVLAEDARNGWAHVGAVIRAGNGDDRGRALSRPIPNSDTPGTYLAVRLARGAAGLGVLTVDVFGTRAPRFGLVTSSGVGERFRVPFAGGAKEAVFPQLVASAGGGFLAIWRAQPSGFVFQRLKQGSRWGVASTVVGPGTAPIDPDASWAVGGPDDTTGAVAWRAGSTVRLLAFTAGRG